MRSHNKPGKVAKTEKKVKNQEEKIEVLPVTVQDDQMISHNIPQMIQPQYQQVFSHQEAKPVVKKTPYIIPELISSDSKNLPSCQQQQINQNYSQQNSLLPEALNPMNLINSATSNNSNYSNHSTSSLLLPSIPTTHHETQQIVNDHQMPSHHFSNHFESTTYLTPTPNILPNSFNFIMGGLDFSKNSLNGEPTYIDY